VALAEAGETGNDLIAEAITSAGFGSCRKVRGQNRSRGAKASPWRRTGLVMLRGRSWPASCPAAAFNHLVASSRAPGSSHVCWILPASRRLWPGRRIFLSQPRACDSAQRGQVSRGRYHGASMTVLIHEDDHEVHDFTEGVALIGRIYTSWVVVRICPVRSLVAIIELDENSFGYPSFGPSADKQSSPLPVRNVALVRSVVGVPRRKPKCNQPAGRAGKCRGRESIMSWARYIGAVG